MVTFLYPKIRFRCSLRQHALPNTMPSIGAVETKYLQLILLFIPLFWRPNIMLFLLSCNALSVLQNLSHGLVNLGGWGFGLDTAFLEGGISKNATSLPPVFDCRLDLYIKARLSIVRCIPEVDIGGRLFFSSEDCSKFVMVPGSQRKQIVFVRDRGGDTMYLLC